MNRSLASSSRRSAGIMSPADSRTTSPGTSVSIGTSAKSPSPAGRAPPHAGGGLHHGAQAGRRLVGAVLLDEGGGDGQQDHQRDHDRRPDVAEKIGNRCQSEQQRVEGVPAADPELLEDRRLALARDEVGAVGLRGGSPPLSCVRPARLDSRCRHAASGASPLTADTCSRVSGDSWQGRFDAPAAAMPSNLKWSCDSIRSDCWRASIRQPPRGGRRNGGWTAASAFGYQVSHLQASATGA